jgi:hypothetical protein
MNESSILIPRFQSALADLDPLVPHDQITDVNAPTKLRRWLDGADAPLPWTDPATVTAEEWFFVTTLCGEVPADEQRAHIRQHFSSLFVAKANRDLRNLRAEHFRGLTLRSSWMNQRLCTMGELLRDRGRAMADYVAMLRRLEAATDLRDPTPALDAVILDHRTTNWRTLSLFVRDGVLGNSFPLDWRVKKELERYNLPADERLLVRLSLGCGRNPREVSRLFDLAASRQ